MSNWLFEIRDQDGLNPVRLTSVTNRKLILALNAPGQANFTVNLNETDGAEENIAESRSQLYVYRDGELKFSGIVMVVERYFSDSEQYANVTALGWLWFFRRRIWSSFADDVHTAEDAGQIALELITGTQNPAFYQDLGITEGEIQDSVDINISLNRTTVKDALEKIAEVSGIEYDISPTKLFNVYYPHKGTDRSNQVKFVYPGNIKNVRVVSDATEILNFVRAFGFGLGDEEINSTVENVESEEVYDTYEAIVNKKDIKEQSALDDFNENLVALKKQARTTIDVTVDGNDSNISLNDYNTGDSIRIMINHPRFQYSQIFRVFEIHADIKENDVEDVRLILALV